MDELTKIGWQNLGFILRVMETIVPEYLIDLIISQ